MRKYLEPETSKFNLEVVKVTHLHESKFDYEIGDISINLAVGGLSWGIAQKIFYVPKNVIIRDTEGKEYKIYASIDFKGFHFRKLERIRWKPTLESLVNTEK